MIFFGLWDFEGQQRLEPGTPHAPTLLGATTASALSQGQLRSHPGLVSSGHTGGSSGVEPLRPKCWPRSRLEDELQKEAARELSGPKWTYPAPGPFQLLDIASAPPPFQ